jgi:SAM-dependent methyltransferase
MVSLLASAIDERIDRCAREHVPAGVCLDVGCGGQPLRERLSQAGFEYVSLDVQQNSSGSVNHLGVIDGQLPASLAGRQFDFIVCTEVLEHVADWPQAFANLASLLKTGGRLLITCPHIWVPHEEPYDFFRPTSWAISHHAQRVGLNALEVTRLGDGYDVLGTVLAAVRLRAPRGRPWMWLVAGPAALLRKFVLVVLNQRWMKAVMDLRTGLYLNTIAVFERR